MTKYCGKCQTPKTLDKFSKFKSSSDGLAYTCKDCVKENDKRRYEQNKATILATQHEYNLKHKEEKAEYDRQYRLEHQETLAEQGQAYYQKYKTRKNRKDQERRKVDPLFKLASYLRTRLWTILKQRTLTKSSKLSAYLGCTLEELKIHIEKQFKPGMTWENQGMWHLDHILPLNPDTQISQEDIYKRCHYTNLQPLWAKDNLQKSNKLPEDLM